VNEKTIAKFWTSGINYGFVGKCLIYYQDGLYCCYNLYGKHTDKTVLEGAFSFALKDVQSLDFFPHTPDSPNNPVVEFLVKNVVPLEKTSNKKSWLRGRK